MAALESMNITKVYHEGGRAFQVLRGIDLTVRQGEVVALEGRSGSGKTTLLSILGCIMQPSAGKVLLAGHAVGESNAVQMRREYLGFVFQNCNLIPALSGKQSISYVLRLKGWRARAARAEAERLLDLVGLADRANFFPRDLSGGEKQRVAIARAMAGNPPVILADEPTANLDSDTAGEILGIFKSLATQANRALLVVTHDHAIRRIADRVLNLRNGSLDLS